MKIFKSTFVVLKLEKVDGIFESLTRNLILI